LALITSEQYSKTALLLDFFQSKGRLINFEVKNGIKDTNDLVTAMMNAVK
jgi:hypothetical protein